MRANIWLADASDVIGRGRVIGEAEGETRQALSAALKTEIADALLAHDRNLEINVGDIIRIVEVNDEDEG